jgi:hypothetical protein
MSRMTLPKGCDGMREMGRKEIKMAEGEKHI